jgi:hypothetical protein
VNLLKPIFSEFCSGVYALTYVVAVSRITIPNFLRPRNDQVYLLLYLTCFTSEPATLLRLRAFACGHCNAKSNFHGVEEQ